MMEEKKEIVDDLLLIRKRLNEIREQTENKTQEMNKIKVKLKWTNNPYLFKNELEKIKENEDNNVMRIQNSQFVSFIVDYIYPCIHRKLNN